MSEKKAFDYSSLKLAAEGKQGVFSIGKSWLLRDIMAFSLGEGKKKVVVFGDLSADSSAPAMFLTEFWKNALSALSQNSLFLSFKLSSLLKKTRICIIPMPNPDGCDLVLNGLSEYNPFYSRILKFAPDKNFDLLKANARGVELEINFSENWLAAKNEERLNGITGPSLFGYGGEYPESEKESAAISFFLRSFSPDAIVIFHKEEKKNLFCRGLLSKAFGNIISGYGDIPFTDREERHGGFSLWAREFFDVPVVDIYLPFNDSSSEKDSIASSIILSAALTMNE